MMGEEENFLCPPTRETEEALEDTLNLVREFIL
jgi:hypothetical protein